MKVRVDEDICVGAAACEALCPRVFRVTKGVSKVQVDVVPLEEEEQVRQIADQCPSGAISIEE